MPFMTANGASWGLTLSTIRGAHPAVAFPANPSDADLLPFGYRWYAETPAPATDDYHAVRETPPTLTSKDIWEQAWELIDLRDGLTAEELADFEAAILARNTPPVPQIITPRQARRALLAAGFLDEVETLLAQAPREVQLDWEYAIEVKRDDPTLLGMAAMLGLTDEQVDDLFRSAAATP